MSFKPGDIAILKTTGEKCVVISTMTFPNQPAVSVSVRRPVATKDSGLLHVDNTFYDFELETFEDQLNREFAEAKQVDDFRARLTVDSQTAKAAIKDPLVN